MKTPREHAINLCIKFDSEICVTCTNDNVQKLQSIICINEQIKVLQELNERISDGGDHSWWYSSRIDEKIEYLEEVKNELNLLK